MLVSDVLLLARDVLLVLDAVCALRRQRNLKHMQSAAAMLAAAPDARRLTIRHTIVSPTLNSTCKDIANSQSFTKQSMLACLSQFNPTTPAPPQLLHRFLPTLAACCALHCACISCLSRSISFAVIA